MAIDNERRVGAALIGLAGGVGSTVAASLMLIGHSHAGLSGLPLAQRTLRGAVSYRGLISAGWDFSAGSLDAAAETNDIVDHRKRLLIQDQLSRIHPWPAIRNDQYCPSLRGDNVLPTTSHRSAIEAVRRRLSDFQREERLDNIVVVNLASTERTPDLSQPCFRSLDAFETALDDDDANISASMLYAYAAVGAGYPFANFTPSFASDIEPIEELARQCAVPIAGKDGKTGQTFLKTVVAPALRDRALHVEGWYSTNLLGNLDGFVLDDPSARASKVATKQSVLNSMLGYSVENHRVDIVYHGSKGDLKEAWDSIDLTGFLGQKMQVKINFLCADSILAAPLVIELVRLLDLAAQTGQTGSVKALAAFFKSPQGFGSERVIHEFFDQQRMLEEWLEQFETQHRHS